MLHPTEADTIIPVIFGRPNGQTTDVWVNGQAAGRMERYRNTNFWTYDYGRHRRAGQRACHLLSSPLNLFQQDTRGASISDSEHFATLRLCKDTQSEPVQSQAWSPARRTL